MKLYDKASLIKTLEDNGYIKIDIQRQNVGGDQLQFAILIQIAERLDKLTKPRDKL